MRIIIITILIFTAACSKETQQDTQGSAEPVLDGNGLTIASIPQGCSIITPNSSGYHQFGSSDNTILLVTAYICGIRENKLCFYYMHSPDLSEPNFKTATHCEEL